VENEYGYYEKDYGEGGKRYAQWSASMAVSQNIGVPWMMCQQWDAPPTVVSLYRIRNTRSIHTFIFLIHCMLSCIEMLADAF
jgi:hypothetical protein